MMNALRLTGGVPTPLFSERTGVPLARISRELAEAVRQGLLDADPACRQGRNAPDATHAA